MGSSSAAAGSFHPRTAGSRNSGGLALGTFARASVAEASCDGWESSAAAVGASTCRPRTDRFGAGVGPLRA